MKTFGQVKATRWNVILLALVGYALLSWFINAVVFPSDLLGPVSRATSHLVQSTLIVNLIGFAIVVGGIVVGLGKLQWQDIGIERSHLAPGALYALAYWVALQAALLVVGISETGGVRLNAFWEAREVTVLIGALLAQVFGTALKEEVFYRGFLLPQLFLKLKGKRKEQIQLYLAGAVLLAALIFALMHVPGVLRLEYSVPRHLAIHTIAGVVYALFYIYSGNLFFVMGVHALTNWKMYLFETEAPAGLVGFVFGVLLAVGWSALVVFRKRRAAKLAA